VTAGLLYQAFGWELVRYGLGTQFSTDGQIGVIGVTEVQTIAGIPPSGDPENKRTKKACTPTRKSLARRV
jgi:hypothetical protein